MLEHFRRGPAKRDADYSEAGASMSVLSLKIGQFDPWSRSTLVIFTETKSLVLLLLLLILIFCKSRAIGRVKLVNTVLLAWFDCRGYNESLLSNDLKRSTPNFVNILWTTCHVFLVHFVFSYRVPVSWLFRSEIWESGRVNCTASGALLRSDRFY